MPSAVPTHRRRLPSPRFYAWAFVATLLGVRIMTAGQGNATRAFSDAPPVTGHCEVVAVLSGDTLLVRQAHLREPVLVRLLSTQAPSPADDGVELTAASTNFARKFVASDGARLRLDNHRLTRSGHYLAYIEVEGQTLNEALLAVGLARFVYFPGNSPSMDRRMSDAQDAAKRGRLGIWAGP